MITRLFWYVLVGLAVIVLAAIVYANWTRMGVPIIFSPKSVLDSTWQKYKATYLEPGTSRTMDLSRGGITTSEGQSYTMLRAVWMDDHPTFDASWKWTQDNLQFKQGDLFSWLFGRRADGTYGVLTDQNGQNSASDADTDIATSLLFAYARWRDPRYLEAAKNIMTAIWSNEVIMVNGKPYLAADNVERLYTASFVVNPSYFSPYAYRMFATVDAGHDWNGLIDTSYSVLKQSMSSRLDKQTSAGLPPDWVLIDRVTGAVTVGSRSGPQGSIDTDYGFDALRIPWRLELDWLWYREPRASQLLSSMTFLDEQWKNNGLLYETYAHDGKPVPPLAESPAMYGGSIGAFMSQSGIGTGSGNDTEAGSGASRGGDAKALYDAKLISQFSVDSDSWKTVLSYYDDNWAWFGIALYNDLLPNLWATVAQ